MLKTRVISATVGFIILAAVLFLYNTLVLNIAFAFVNFVALLEMTKVTGVCKNKILRYFIIFYLTILFFIPKEIFTYNNGIFFYLYLLALVIIVLFSSLVLHKDIDVISMGFCLFMCIFITVCLHCIVLMRDLLGHNLGMFTLFVSLVGAWGSDTGGYTIGGAMGKHKLCPQISPHKTVEGVYGGIVFAIGFQLILSFIYSIATKTPIILLNVYLSPIISLISVEGDLIFSLIKRHYGIKDYGNIMPGHGGALDRFDSVMPLLPLVLLIFLLK